MFSFRCTFYVNTECVFILVFMLRNINLCSSESCLGHLLYSEFRSEPLSSLGTCHEHHLVLVSCSLFGGGAAWVLNSLDNEEMASSSDFGDGNNHEGGDT